MRKKKVYVTNDHSIEYLTVIDVRQYFKLT